MALKKSKLLALIMVIRRRIRKNKAEGPRCQIADRPWISELSQIWQKTSDSCLLGSGKVAFSPSKIPPIHRHIMYNDQPIN
jgi:hypothetical protein